MESRAGETFAKSLAGLVNGGDVEAMIVAQKKMLQRFEKTNEMLVNCNALSKNRFKSVNDEFKRHVKFLSEMKKDLDYIFRKIKVAKQKLSKQYALTYPENNPTLASTDGAPASASASGLTSIVESKKPTRNNNSFFDTETKTETTVEYVPMDDSMENEKKFENELIKKEGSFETGPVNDSSDGTSEDTY